MINRKYFVLLVLLLGFIQCGKQFTYCIFRGEQYALKKNIQATIFYQYDKNYNLNNNMDSINYYIGQGYKLDTFIYDFECKGCNEQQRQLAESKGGYCISN